MSDGVNLLPHTACNSSATYTDIADKTKGAKQTSAY